MFSKIFYGAVLGSLVFAASETYVHAGTPKGAPQVRKTFKFTPKTDVTRGQSAPELGFAVDILDLDDWKALRGGERTPFTTLATDETETPKKSKGGS